jgi:hypothetical protein
MAAIEYQVLDLIEINELARELTTPNDVAEERFGGVGMSAIMELLDALRQKRIRIVQVIPDAQGCVAEQIPMDTAALAKGIPAAVYDRMQPTPSGWKLYCTLATVAEVWPQLRSAERWRAREAPSAPVAEKAPAVADRPETPSGKAPLRPLGRSPPTDTVAAIKAHLLPLGKLSQEEAWAITNELLASRGSRISRERFRELDRTTLNRPKRGQGEHRPKDKSPA